MLFFIKINYKNFALLLILPLLMAVLYTQHSQAQAKPQDSISSKKSGARIYKSQKFVCYEGNEAKETRHRANFVFYGYRKRSNFIVHKTAYSFIKGKYSKLGDKNNLNIRSTQTGKTLWESPDALRSGKNRILRQRFVLPRRHILEFTAIFDQRQSFDDDCQALGQIQ